MDGKSVYYKYEGDRYNIFLKAVICSKYVFFTIFSGSLIAKKQEELQKLQDKINCQSISLEEKEKLTKEKHELHRMIQFYENSIRELENTAFSVEIKFAEEQRKVQ